ncbi:cyclase [Prauserella shujinwangii]|uniref:Cyclase n=1 Tax=Prauserella shujinwangii TaxID=1453103 RepID=A0A2T0M3X0_9PSEU|nr:MBL fold metallo-hydrolase [Prauserella shujinwangii]PRX51420.1 cyclase [Prauserella shujinwangii]
MDTSERTVTGTSMREVADGVFAYVQRDGGWCVNNAGVVVGGDTTIVIDTAATERRARRFREQVDRVAPRGPDILVNTHHHGDHVFGNAQFAPQATIVAHELTRTEMLEAGTGLRDLWPDVEWGDTPLVPPTVTFPDALTLHAGGLRVELLHLGPAHTTDDVVVWVPDRGVVFTGDIVMSGATPFCLMGSLTGSLRAIDRLRALGAHIVVSGHGEVAGPDVFAANEAYLRWVRDVAERGVRAGLSPLEAAREADLTGFAHLLDPERLAANLHRAYAELAGRPEGASIDLRAGFEDMVAYHGGLPVSHA